MSILIEDATSKDVIPYESFANQIAGEWYVRVIWNIMNEFGETVPYNESLLAPSELFKFKKWYEPIYGECLCVIESYSGQYVKSFLAIQDGVKMVFQYRI